MIVCESLESALSEASDCINESLWALEVFDWNEVEDGFWEGISPSQGVDYFVINRMKVS